MAPIRAIVAVAIVASAILTAAPGTAIEPAAGVRIEYIAHASFVIQSAAGTRIALDPYNGGMWLGYSFPAGIEADGVAVTHPHYDHDATYYFSNDTPVFRKPGEYAVGDVTLRGVASEHAGAARFLDRFQTPYNTIWVVETGGLTIAHMGDNRLLTEADLEALGRIDVMMVQARYLEDASSESLSLLIERSGARMLIPMHYRHAELSELPRGLRPIEEYTAGRDVEAMEGNVVELESLGSGSSGSGSGAAGSGTAGGDATAPDEPRIVVLRPSPAVASWPERLHEAWVEADEGAGMLRDADSETDEARAEEARWEGLFHYEAAIDLAPEVLKFGYGAGGALADLEQINDAIETLDHALARAPQGDWTDRARVHMLLAQLYETVGEVAIAVAHYEMVASQEHTHETRMREQARSRLLELRRQED